MNIKREINKFRKKLFKNESKIESPDVIFQKLKKNQHSVTIKTLDDYYKKAAKLATECIETEQIYALEKLTFLMKCIEKEKQLLPLGISNFIFRDDIDEFLSRRDIQESSIKIIELSDYPRRIPKEIQKKIKESKHLFDKMYVLFTDYTESVTKNYQREKEIKRKDKDPILFGTFQTIDIPENRMLDVKRQLNDKFYVIGDWVDEYCDLTLEKFISLTSPEVVHPINEQEFIKSLDEIITETSKLKEMEKKFYV